MKKIILISFITLISLSAFSQQNPEEYKTIFNKDKVSHGGYGGLTFNYSSIDGKNAMVLGARGGWIIDHGISIGMAGYGFMNDIHFDDIPYNSDVSLVGGYGGLLIESIILPNAPIHISIPLLIGVGGVGYVDDWNFNFNRWENHAYEYDAFFVIEPGIEVELNLVKFMRLAAGVYYRHTSNIQMANTDENVLNGLSTGITLKFGKF